MSRAQPDRSRWRCSEWPGNGSATVTLDTYGHLFDRGWVMWHPGWAPGSARDGYGLSGGVGAFGLVGRTGYGAGFPHWVEVPSLVVEVSGAGCLARGSSVPCRGDRTRTGGMGAQDWDLTRCDASNARTSETSWGLSGAELPACEPVARSRACSRTPLPQHALACSRLRAVRRDSHCALLTTHRQAIGPRRGPLHSVDHASSPGWVVTNTGSTCRGWAPWCIQVRVGAQPCVE